MRVKTNSLFDREKKVYYASDKAM